MRTLVVPVLALSLFALPSRGQLPPDDAKVRALTSDLHAISRIASLSRDLRDTRQVMLAIIDENIESLREMRPDGTYRWASLQREDGGRVSDEKRVLKVHTETDLQLISVTAPHPYRVLVTAPSKRSLFSSNNRVFVRNILVESTAFDGTTSKLELPVNVWVSPGDTHGVALPEIGKSARATVELAVESGNKRAVAEVSLIEAKLVDDPAGPWFPAVSRLLQVREAAAAGSVQRGPLKTLADEAILSLPGEIERRTAEQQRAIEDRNALLASGETKGRIESGDSTPDVLHELREIRRLLSGNLDEQTEARRRLQELTDALAPTM